jgi:two-component system, OmpR family, KDP operon response regulator KdpE
MSDPALVLVVDDEPQTRRFLRATLKNRGFEVVEASSGIQALEEAAARKPDLVLLDLGLPDLDGVHVTQKLRQWSFVPIIVLSVRDREDDKIEALDAGANDYLTKPFGSGELLARMRVALRPTSRAQDSLPSPLFSTGDLRVDLGKRHVSVAGNEITLTPTEYELLSVLIRSAGKVITHRALLKEVWGPAYADRVQYLRVFMAQLRRKLEPDHVRPRYLVTVPGVGYRIRMD